MTDTILNLNARFKKQGFSFQVAHQISISEDCFNLDMYSFGLVFYLE